MTQVDLNKVDIDDLYDMLESSSKRLIGLDDSAQDADATELRQHILMLQNAIVFKRIELIPPGK